MKDITIHYTDDDFEDLEMFKKAVEKSNVNVTLRTYNSGDEFLESIRKDDSSNSIAFLDLNMPGKSGFEVLKNLRDTTDFKNLPVVMYSTSSDENAISTSKDIGATMYAVKPTSFTTLKKMIEKIIDINWQKFKTPPESFVFNNA
jgi:DNA-binding response OmpR family regulator